MIHFAVGLPVGASDSRNEEFAYCLEKNLGNIKIAKVTAIIEEVELPPGDRRNKLLLNPKVEVFRLGRRATFSDYMEILSRGPASMLKAFSNADVHFDFTLGHLDGADLGEAMLTMTRVDWTAKLDYLPANDAWIFARAPKVKADFFLGYDWCDFGFTELLSNAGYTVLNPSHSIRLYHIHREPTNRTDEQKVHSASFPTKVEICHVVHGAITHRETFPVRKA